MRFIADRNSLLRALGHITGIVERRNTIPILSNILIAAEASGVLTLKATDLDMEAIETIPAKVDTPGAVTVPAHTLHDIVRKLPDGAEIHIERLGPEGRLKVRAGRASFELSILPADEFPDMGQTELPHRFTVEGGELETPVREVALCDLDRGNPLLPERHLPAPGRRRWAGQAQGGRDRRPQARTGRDGGDGTARKACPA